MRESETCPSQQAAAAAGVSVRRANALRNDIGALTCRLGVCVKVFSGGVFLVPTSLQYDDDDGDLLGGLRASWLRVCQSASLRPFLACVFCIF